MILTTLLGLNFTLLGFCTLSVSLSNLPLFLLLPLLLPTLFCPLTPSPTTCQLMPIRPAVGWCGGRVWDWDHLAFAHSCPLLSTCQDQASHNTLCAALGAGRLKRQTCVDYGLLMTHSSLNVCDFFLQSTTLTDWEVICEKWQITWDGSASCI